MILPPIDFATYMQDRCREAWKHAATSEACRAFLKRHALVKPGAPPEPVYTMPEGGNAA